MWINAFIISSAYLVILHDFIFFFSRNFLRPWLIYILLRLILHINIFKKCITCNFSSLTLAHSQAGRRAEDKAEEAGVLVFFFDLFSFLYCAFRFLDLSARSMHSQLKHELQLTYLLITHTVASSLLLLIFSFCTQHGTSDCAKWFHMHLKKSITWIVT